MRWVDMPTAIVARIQGRKPAALAEKSEAQGRGRVSQRYVRLLFVRVSVFGMKHGELESWMISRDKLCDHGI